MTNMNVTAAAVISFAEKLEDDSATFYLGLAERFAEKRFQGFASDSRKNKVQIVRTYQETVTDALETGFAFKGLDLEAFAANTELEAGITYQQALEQAVALEERAIQFHLDIAERGRSLLATIPGAFKRVAKKRARRKAELESLLR